MVKEKYSTTRKPAAMKGGGLQLAYDTGKGVRVGYDKKTGFFFNVAKTITQKGLGKKKHKRRIYKRRIYKKNKKGDWVKNWLGLYHSKKCVKKYKRRIYKRRIYKRRIYKRRIYKKKTKRGL